jgi:hypothetical protein
MTVSPMRKNTSSIVSHSASKGMPSPFDFTALYPLGNRTGKKRLLPRATPLEKGAANRKKSYSTLAYHIRRKKRQGKILFRCLKARPSIGFIRTTLGLQGSEPNTDQGFEGWPLERAPKTALEHRVSDDYRYARTWPQLGVAT